MPRPVVPTKLWRLSTCLWWGRTRWALSETRILGSNPSFRRPSTSSWKRKGSMTIPSPRTFTAWGWMTPEGRRLSLKTLPSATTVWPALAPPW